MPLSKLLKAGLTTMAKKHKDSGSKALARVKRKSATAKAKTQRELEAAKKELARLNSKGVSKSKLSLAHDKVTRLQKLVDIDIKHSRKPATTKPRTFKPSK